MADLRVVPITRAGDIPGMLRKFADEIDAGAHPDLRFAVLLAVNNDTSMETYGYGQCSPMEAIGALAMAIHTRLGTSE